MKKVCLFWLITFSALLSASAADPKLEPSGEIVKKELTDWRINGVFEVKPKGTVA
jgi:hypothetical protein